MSGLLLDTNALLWMLAGSPRLGRSARDEVEAAPDVRVSVVTLWEATIKAGVGKLVLPDDLAGVVDRLRLRRLGIEDRHLVRLAELPMLHRDPFDRMLIAQAQADNLTVVTSDAVFAQYGVPVLDALS